MRRTLQVILGLQISHKPFVIFVEAEVSIELSYRNFAKASRLVHETLASRVLQSLLLGINR